MKLKTIILAGVSSAALLAASSSMAGFMLVNKSSLDQHNIKVSCEAGKSPTAAVWNINLPWGLVNSQFLNNTSHGDCIFYNGTTRIGDGTVDIQENKTGSVSNINVLDKSLSITSNPAKGENVLITIANAS